MRGAGGDRSGRAEGGILSPSHPFFSGWENTLPAHNRTLSPSPAHNRILAPPPRCSPHCTRGAGAGWVVAHTFLRFEQGQFRAVRLAGSHGLGYPTGHRARVPGGLRRLSGLSFIRVLCECGSPSILVEDPTRCGLRRLSGLSFIRVL